MILHWSIHTMILHWFIHTMILYWSIHTMILYWSIHILMIYYTDLQCTCIHTPMILYWSIHTNDTTVELLIKDTLNKGHLTTRDTFLVPFWYFRVLNDPSTKDTFIKKDKFAGPNGVCYRGLHCILLCTSTYIDHSICYHDRTCYHEWTVEKLY